MKQFSCGDVVPGCTRSFSGTEAEILSAVEDHARAEHALDELPPDTVAQIRRSIR